MPSMGSSALSFGAVEFAMLTAQELTEEVVQVRFRAVKEVRSECSKIIEFFSRLEFAAKWTRSTRTDARHTP